ncbi:phage holin family protein [Fusibacter sp. JL298sf-3]
MHESTLVKGTVTTLGTIGSLVFGGVDLLFKILILFIALDYVTGVMKGAVEKNLSSDIGWRGLMKKIGTLIAVIVAHQMDKVAGTQVVRTAVMMFFVANEGISLTENLSVIGVPIPKVMMRTLKAWKDSSEVE